MHTHMHTHTHTHNIEHPLVDCSSTVDSNRFFAPYRVHLERTKKKPENELYTLEEAQLILQWALVFNYR